MQDTCPQTFRELTEAHRGKLSDKWSFYIEEYQRLFSAFQALPVTLLEIGVQNGGSLEIWAKYFPNARALIGCDINENCRALKFQDPRIKLVVGDANSDSSYSEIIGPGSNFDIIIDDGSHTSEDIVRSFSRYFPHLNSGGIFLAEDLHCSYWSTFGGGLFNGLSSIAFFKDLADVLNHEHWGIPETRAALLDPFRTAYGAQFKEEDLAQIKSVEFMNSMCVVRKCEPLSARLGTRRFFGEDTAVYDAAGSAEEAVVPDERTNIWSQTGLFKNRAASANTAKEISNLTEEVARIRAERDATQLALDRTALELGQAKRQIGKLEHNLTLRDNSLSWKLTAPLRAVHEAWSRR